MDTTEKYIKMCEKAEEIQKKWKPIVGDYTTWCADPKVRILGGTAYKIWRMIYPEQEIMQYSLCHPHSLSNYVWLPRQDQLQEMMGFQNPMDYRKWWFDIGIGRDDDDYYFKFDSWDKYWLAFVMKEKFNKTWDDEEEGWISL